MENQRKQLIIYINNTCINLETFECQNIKLKRHFKGKYLPHIMDKKLPLL